MGAGIWECIGGKGKIGVVVKLLDDGGFAGHGRAIKSRLARTRTWPGFPRCLPYAATTDVRPSPLAAGPCNRVLAALSPSSLPSAPPSTTLSCVLLSASANSVQRKLYAQSLTPLFLLTYRRCQLHKPFCQPFGNRRLIQCKNSTALPTEPLRPHYAQHPPNLAGSDTPSEGDVEEGAILAWESCGRVVSAERADFFEFAAVNLLFLSVGAGIVIWRLRRMRLRHARQLAARIGLVGRTR